MRGPQTVYVAGHVPSASSEYGAHAPPEFLHGPLPEAHAHGAATSSQSMDHGSVPGSLIVTREMSPISGWVRTCLPTLATAAGGVHEKKSVAPVAPVSLISGDPVVPALAGSGGSEPSHALHSKTTLWHWPYSLNEKVCPTTVGEGVPSL